MARVTVEDCVTKIPNRFELVVCAAQRVREIMSGIPATVPEDNDKVPVIALREIAQGTVLKSHILASVILAYQSYVSEEQEEDILDSLTETQDWIQQAQGSTMDEEIEEDGLAVVDHLDSPEDLLGEVDLKDD